MVELAVRAFLTLFVLVDPVGLAPVFLGLTARRSVAERERIARRAVLMAAVLLILFALGGSWLLGNLHISLDAFRTAGGVLLFRIAVDMVFAHLERETEEERREAHGRTDLSVFPLAIPLIAGPGALAGIMILAGEARPLSFGVSLVLAVCMLVLAIVYVALRIASPIAKLLGQTGVNVITRVLGVLLAALAVQYIADGIRGLLHAG
jgi:multiple antibiotic resistance protein